MIKAKKDYHRILEFMPEEVHSYCEIYIDELEKELEELKKYIYHINTKIDTIFKRG